MMLSDRPEDNFSDSDWLKHVESLNIPHLNDWMRSQALRGQDYYLRRLDRLGFSGGCVLDAGCGVGNWAIALARRFKNVEAIDNDAERVDVLSGIAPHLGGQVHAAVGSVTALAYEDAQFDAVFCNGVVFLTDTEAALAELVRVLRPSGVLYVTYNGPDWWRHLIRDRAPSEPVCYMYGANGLVTWAFRLAGELNLPELVDASEREAVGEALAAKSITTVLALVRDILNRIEAQGISKRHCRDLLECIADLTTPGVDLSYSERVATDIGSLIVHGTAKHEVLIDTYTYRPEDMTEILSRLGMVDIMSAREGGLCLSQDALPVSPIYTANQGVFESIARKS